MKIKLSSLFSTTQTVPKQQQYKQRPHKKEGFHHRSQPELLLHSHHTLTVLSHSLVSSSNIVYSTTTPQWWGRHFPTAHILRKQHTWNLNLELTISVQPPDSDHLAARGKRRGRRSRVLRIRRSWATPSPPPPVCLFCVNIHMVMFIWCVFVSGDVTPTLVPHSSQSYPPTPPPPHPPPAPQLCFHPN